MLEYRGALTADFQRFYGLRLNDALQSDGVLWCADLARWLPPEAAVWGCLDPRATWSTSDYLNAMAVDALRWLVWAKTKDGQKNRRQPKPIPRPQPPRARNVVLLTTEQVRERLARPRRNA